MALANVKFMRYLTVGTVKCAEVTLTTPKATKTRIIPIRDAFNLDMAGDFNKYLIEYLDPVVHLAWLAPQGNICRTCKGRYEKVVPKCEPTCPYDFKYNGAYIYVLTKYAGPHTLIITRATGFWHIDNNIKDCIYRGGTRLNQKLHHRMMDSSHDAYKCHRYVDSNSHSSVHSILTHAEDKYVKISNKYFDALAIKGTLPSSEIVRLKQERGVARIKMFEAFEKMRDVPEDSNLPTIMAEYRQHIKQGHLYIPKVIGNHSTPDDDHFANRSKRRTKEEMIQAGLK